MLQIIFSRIGWFLLLLLLQVLLFNKIHIGGYATPLPYVYLLLILPSSTPRWLYLFVGFFFGLTLDLFTNTPGMAAAALCASGLVVPWFLIAFAPKDKSEGVLLPSALSLEWGAFLRYTFFTSLFHCAIFFCIESFSFFHWSTLLLNIVCSTAMTFACICSFEWMRCRMAVK